MDFTNRNVRNGQQPVHANGQGGIPGGVPNATANANDLRNKKRENDRFGKIFSIGSVVLLLAIAILIGALASFFALGNNGDESQYINKDEYQAVFVNVNGTNGGQVYFGHIQNLTNGYIDLTNVFYIQNQNSSSSNSSSSSANSYTLVKLGCELHAPEDQMLINHSQVYFWENLKNSGQVAQKIAQYYKANPTGQNCSQASNANSPTQSSTNTQNSTTNTDNSSTNDTSTKR
ncbi:MAG TPA: hypothetical protein VGG13_02655 [Candidatus Saccharimonadales bacterium]|jgi:hypothetical protein